MKTDPDKLDSRSLELRRSILDTLAHSRRGHVAPALGLVEILRVLYDDILNMDPDQPDDPDRDRFVLSKGHGCLALYAVLADKGFFSRDLLPTFCRFDSPLGGHPERGSVPGIEATTGSLGHGLAIGAGFALSAKLDKRRFRTFVLVGDGECNEGTIWEAIMLAAHHHLDNLIIIVDINGRQCYSETKEVMNLEPFGERWQGFGCAVKRINGHSVEALRSALNALPFEPGKPNVLLCDTIKGKGVGVAENDINWHHKSRISDDELGALYASLGKEPA